MAAPSALYLLTGCHLQLSLSVSQVARDLFEGRDYVEFETYEGKRVFLHRDTWARKVRKHVAHHLELNFDKVGITLSDPDAVVRSGRRPGSLLYFKRFHRFRGDETEEVPPALSYLLVVVRAGQWVQSAYRVNRVSRGEKLWPR